MWLEIELERFAASRPGQFVQVLCRDETAPAPHFANVNDESWTPSDPAFHARGAFLRRPFSIAARHDAGTRTRISLISRSVGPGTRRLERIQRGDSLNVTGPLGTPFKHVGDEAPVLLVGGGVGIPPLIYLARQLAERRGVDLTAIFAARTRDLLPIALRSDPQTDGCATPCLALAGLESVPAIIATDDGSLGMRGVATAAIEGWRASRGAAGARPVICACGPDAMLRGVARIAARLDCACQLCIERMMGCGFGTCLSCVVRVREPNAGGTRWALACVEGPVFDAETLVDY